VGAGWCVRGRVCMLAGVSWCSLVSGVGGICVLWVCAWTCVYVSRCKLVQLGVRVHVHACERVDILNQSAFMYTSGAQVKSTRQGVFCSRVFCSTFLSTSLVLVFAC
jgi:hypothetical protein